VVLYAHTEGDNGQAGHAEEFALKRRISSTAAAVYTGVPGLPAGFLLQNPISFAYMLADRVSQDTFAFQPAVLFFLLDGWCSVAGTDKETMAGFTEPPKFLVTNKESHE
jgi:hypothetical protein